MSDDLQNRYMIERLWIAIERAKAAEERVEELEAKAMKASYAAFLEKRRADEAQDKLAKAVEALEKLARLGNGDRYGNSDGNMIARTTIAELKGKTDD